MRKGLVAFFTYVRAPSNLRQDTKAGYEGEIALIVRSCYDTLRRPLIAPSHLRRLRSGAGAMCMRCARCRCLNVALGRASLAQRPRLSVTPFDARNPLIPYIKARRRSSCIFGISVVS